MRRFFHLLMLIGLAGTAACGSSPLLSRSRPSPGREAAQKMARASRGVLAPVYAPLARQIVEDFHLADKEGIGIDIGSGPGTLIIELCKHSRLHWVNADINPYFFAGFFESAQAAGVGHRVSAMLADAQALPFRDDYADVIVSRGSFHLWQDKPSAFREIYRVLKPGGIAYVGRGFSANLPIEVARKIRGSQAKRNFPKYDVNKTQAELHEVMKTAGFKNYRIRIPKSPQDETVLYGIWVEIHK